MTKYIGSDQRLKSSGNSFILFMIVGNLLLALGLISQFAPNLLEQLVSKQDARLLHDYSLVLIVAGLVLEAVSVWSKIKSHHSQALAQRNGAASNSTSNPADRNASSHRHSTDSQASFDTLETEESLFEQVSNSAPHIDWTPLKSGGASFKTHRLITPKADCIEFKASTGLLLFSLFFSGMGALVGGVFLVSTQEIFPTLIGLIFVAAGALIYYFTATPRVFDKQLGYYWKGRCKERNLEAISKLKEKTELSKIYGVQLISEYVRGNKSSYYSHELNLVLNDGHRINVVDHGNRKQIEQDAQTLAQFLKVPVLYPERTERN